MAFIQVHMRSTCLHRQIRFNAYIPIDAPFVIGAEQKPFRTLYLLHGYTGGSASWFNESLPIYSYANDHGLAVIIPDGENHFYVDDPTSGDKYGEFIGRELVDFTRQVFPLSAAREDTIIGGISMGGYGALHCGMKYSDVFGHILGISPANILERKLSATDQPDEVGAVRGHYEMIFGDLDAAFASDKNLDVCAKEMLDSGRPLPDLYFSCGSEDMLCDANRRFRDTLVSLGIPHVFEEDPGVHNPDYFNPHFAAQIERLCPIEK